jgi:LacI family xylobiose transport system transcriptional regulator
VTSSTPTERTTLASVAGAAGVSLATVSKVLNARTDVSPATRARVETLLEQAGYQRRGGTRSQSTFVELVFHELESLWALEIIRGAEAAARARGMSVVLTESGDRHAPAADWIAGVLQRRPAGVLLVFSDLTRAHKEQLLSRGIPFVIIDPAGDPSPDVSSVGSANWSGGLAATRHLIDLGHTRIAAITGPQDMMCSHARLDGYRSAMQAAGLEIDPALVAYGDFHVDGGRTNSARMLALDDPPTAIFAGSDLQALGVYDTARMLGVSVPGELSVVGYDDLQVAEWTSPALTTIHQPLKEMAEAAVTIVLEQSAPGSPPRRMDLSTSLVLRASTGAPGRTYAAPADPSGYAS